MKSIFEKTLNNWKKLSDFFWGDPFDFRFLAAIQLSNFQSKNVLDIGCSVGVTINSSNAIDKVGIDINIDALKKGKKVFPKTEFIAASADYLPFKEQSFDLIISIHTMDTASLNSKIVASEITRISKSKGKIFLTGNWYNHIYTSKSSQEKKVYGYWIKNLKETFDLDVRWYVRPNLKKINLKLKRIFLKKCPNLFLKLHDMDEWFNIHYNEFSNPLKMEPYIVKGRKKS